MNNFTTTLDIQTANDNINTYLNSEYQDYKASLKKSLGLHIAQICSIITGVVSLGSLFFLPDIYISAGMFRLCCLAIIISVAVFIISTALLIRNYDNTDTDIFDYTDFDKSDLSFESFKDYYVNNHKSYVALLYNLLNNTAESYKIVDILFTKTSSHTGDITIHYSIDNCVYYCIIKQINLYDNMQTDLTDHTLDLTPDITQPQFYMAYDFVSKLKNKYSYHFDIDDVTEKINNYRTERTINNDIQ